MEFFDLLKLLVDKKGSDLFVTVGAPPSIKIRGKIMPVGQKKLDPEQARKTIYEIMSDPKKLNNEILKRCRRREGA